MADAVVPVVEALRVEPRKPVHPARESREPGLDDDVNVVAHQAVRVDAPVESGHALSEQLDERGAVVVVEEDGLACDAPAGDVVDPLPREDVARPSGHRRPP